VPWRSRLEARPLGILVTFALMFLSFLGSVPDSIEPPTEEPVSPPAPAVRLLMAKPPPVEVAKPSPKQPAKAPKTPKVAKREAPVRPPPKTTAMAALEKVFRSGPALKNLMEAPSRANKRAGKSLGLASLLGQGQAHAGIGALGLGGAGTGGTRAGRHLLRGGVGLLGGGSRYGKGGSVQGTVAQAPAREVGVAGEIDRDKVAQVISAHIHQVQSCYERGLLKAPGLSGKLMLEWAIGLNGAVQFAKVKSSSLRSGEVEGCILSQLKRWRFPLPRGGPVVITYPFVFSALGD
jgi:outer membrane biosynthesis protein TonB